MELFGSMACGLVAFVGAVFASLMLPRPVSPEQRRMQRQLVDLHERLQKLEAAGGGEPGVLPITPTPAEVPLAADLVEEPPPATPAVEPSEATEPGPVAIADDDPVPAATDAPPPGEVEAPADRPLAPRPTLSPEKVAVWIGASLGALALAVGALLGLVAAAEAGWIGPGLRVAAGLVAGTVAWVGSAVVRRRSPVASSALSGAGASAVFGAVWAATSLYNLVPSPVGFALLLGVVGMAMAQASRFQDRFLGLLATLGGLFASTIIGTDDAALRVGYGLVLSTAVAGLALRRSWAELLPLTTAGLALQLVGWTALWRSPDNQATALVGIALLALPYAFVAARSRDDLTAGLAALSAAAFPVLATPWVPAIDTQFYDPRSGLAFVRDSVGAWPASLGLLALPLPLWLAGRLRGSVWPVLLGALAVLPAAFAYGVGWSEPTVARALLPLGLLAVGLAFTTGRRDLGMGLLPLALVGLFPLVDADPAGAALLAMVAFAALTTLGSWYHTSSAMTGLALPIAAITALRATDASGPPSLGAAVAISACLGLFLVPLTRSWADEPAPALPWLASLAAPAAFFPALYIVWDERLGDDLIGVLPLLLAALALVGTALLQRVHRVQRHELVFAAGVAVVLSGVTMALPLQLEMRWLTVGLSLEAAALAALSRRVPHPLMRWGAVGLSLVVAARLLLNPWALEWGSADGIPLLNWTLYTWGVPTVSLVYVAKRLHDDLPDHPAMGFATSVLQLLAMFTGFALVNVQVSHAFQTGSSLTLSGTTMLQGMVRSLAWGGYGMGLLVLGLNLQKRSTRFVGFGFVLLAALKVFLVDLWSLPGFIRVGSLLGLGLFLVVAAFLFERLVLRERTSEDGA